MGNHNTRHADIEFKVSANGKSELKKFTFTCDVRDVLVVDDYHRALFKFLMEKISSIPEAGKNSRPEQRCTDYLITVQDKIAEKAAHYGDGSSCVFIPWGVRVLIVYQHGMMVRCHGEEEFVSALSGYHSWRRCLRMEAYGYALPRCSRPGPPIDELRPGVEVSKPSKTPKASKGSRSVDSERRRSRAESTRRRIRAESTRRQHEIPGTLPAPPQAADDTTHISKSSSPNNPFA